MPFPQRLLGDHEEIVYDLHPHWWTLVGPILVTVVVAVAAVAGWAFLPGGGFQRPGQLAIGGIAVLCLLVVVVLRYLRWESAGERGQSVFKDIPKPEAVQVEIYRQMEANGQRMSGAAPRAPSVLEDLERLANLRDRGAVTNEEFERKKRDLLDRL